MAALRSPGTGRPPGLRAKRLFWFILFAALIPWLVVRAGQATNSDTLWLCEALHRFFEGFRLTDAAYELNPPLSMLLYTLPVLGQSWLGIPLTIGTFAQSCLIVGVSALAAYRILSNWGVLKQAEIMVVTAGFVVATTICASAYFGERDHLLGAVLFPFFLTQLGITYNLPRAKGWSIASCFFGALFILLKPHHGLLPTLILLHRAIRRRNLSALRDPDFIAMATMTPFYILFVCLVFPGYVTTIFPDAIHLYVQVQDSAALRMVVLGSIAALWMACGFFCLLEAPVTESGVWPAYNLVWALMIAAAISVIPYLVQGKWFYYQALPAIMFLVVGMGLVLYLWLETQTTRGIALALIVLMLVFGAYIFAPLNLAYPKHGDIAKSRLAQLIRKDCPHNRPCSFFMFNDSMGFIQEISYYMGIHHASRFPSFWFLPMIAKAEHALADGKKADFTPAQTKAYFKKYADMVAADLAQGKPDVVLLWRSKKSSIGYGFIPFFSRDPKFVKAWKPYRKVDVFTTSYRDFYKIHGANANPLVYDVYRRVGR